MNEIGRFGGVNYAREELRAELAGVCLAAERGHRTIPNTAPPMWALGCKALKEDKNGIFRAAHDTSKATGFLLTLER